MNYPTHSNYNYYYAPQGMYYSYWGYSMKTSIKRSLLATLLTPGLVVAADNNERDQEHVLVTATRTEQPFSDTISASAILDRADIRRPYAH